jgi:Domain of unknown function (DUF4440)
MSRFFKLAILCSSLLGILLVISSIPLHAADASQAALAADHEYVQAAAKSDTTALKKLLDADFTWTSADGKRETRSEILKTLPKPLLGSEAGAKIKRLTYGEVSAVMADRGMSHVLRVWVKRPAGWRLLVYHEVEQSNETHAPPKAGATDCENPCKTLPYEPKNDAERGVIASWQALETGVTHHDSAAWAPHIADEFVIVSSANSHPFSKADRIAVLNRQKQAGVGSAPSPLVSARMFDFPGAIVMTCLHQPYSGKPIHVSRVWIERDGKWVLVISYQTKIQGAPAK